MDDFNANFIPLGSGSGPIPGRAPGRVAISRSERVIGETKEERKRIAREIRLAAKKAKKKEKADAKRARKLNGILHRRMTKNPEKYTKNKDRNRQRAIDLERQKIQFGAVHQCERLAAQHDPSGKMFNVGEVIVTPEGKVKSKEALQREAERLAQQKAEKEAEALQPRNKRISKNQLKRQEMLKPKPVPPKPVIPYGIALPEGEENLVALFDITDQEIEVRLRKQKSAKKQAAKDLRKIQKEKKKLNRAMKLRKKQCAYAGVTWDPERARREIIGEMTKEAEEESNSDSDSDSDSSDDDSDAEGETNGETSKGSKKRTSSSENLEPVEGKKKLPPLQRPKLDLELIAKAEELERQRQAKKLLARQRRREERKRKAEEEARKAEEEAKKANGPATAGEAENTDAVQSTEKRSENKRKRSKDDDEEVDGTSKKDKSHKKKKVKTSEIGVETENAVQAASADDEPVKKKKRSKTEDSELVLKEEDESAKKKKSKSKDADVGGKDEPEKKKKKKRDRTESEANGEGLDKKERKTKRKLEEGNDNKLDRQIAEQEAKLKAQMEQTGEDARNGAEHWNPDALSGDAARKDKFLRLLGAGKNGIESDGKKSKKEKSKTKNSAEEINKIQTELERQYEAGMKLKHDAGSKKRGLGA